MRILVTVLAAGLVLASCEHASTEHPAEAEGPTKTVKTLENPENAAFHPTWGAPSCSAPGSRCDSMGLLVGRGVFGPEPHHPNTLGGSCADGTGDTATSRISLERLVVSRADGTAFAAGKQVTIQATTAGYDSYGEHLELYTASDPSNPTWSHIATLTQRDSWIEPYTWTTSYLLPTSGWRVFRVVHRKASPGTAAAPCSSAPDADHDDLVIAVGEEPDATPPVVAFTSPAQGTTLQGNIDVTVEASDDFGVHRVELYDGATLVASDSSAPYSLRWATRTAPNGSHTLTARAYDLAGNSSTSAPVDVLLDNDFVPPQVAFLTPADGSTVSQTISLSGLVSDDRGVVRVTIEALGRCSGMACPIQLLEVASATPFEHFQLDWNSRGTPNGTVALLARAHDAAGNASPQVRLNVVVDNDFSPPRTALTAPASGSLLSGHVSLEASASDDRQLSGVSFYVDGELLGTDTTAPFALSWDTESVPNGGHTLHTVASDAAGNRTTSASITVETSNAGSVHHDPVLKVPRCELVRARCDSGPLLKGRATFGPEQNTPNTLDGCLDGKSGYSYSPKQSIERIRVSREDGTALATGKRVRLEVDVWVPSGSTQSLWLFSAADATAPSWAYLTAIKPSASGFQTLSAEYVLPAGGVQAVRAKFGEGGNNSIPCGEGSSQSSWVDRDDLVFAVGQEADTTPPVVALTAPAGGATGTGWVTLTAEASDNFGVAAVDFFDGQTLLGTAAQAPFRLDWNSRSVPNGSHTLTARARDAAGNVAVSQPVTVTVDNDLTPPAVVITAPASGATLESHTVVELSAFATDDRGVIKRVDFYTGSYSLLGSDTSAPFTYPWHVYASWPSSVTLTAVAFDAAGNHVRSEPVVVTLTPELTPPSVSLTAPGDGATLTGLVTLSASADDTSGIAQVEFLLDGVLLETDATVPYGYAWDTRTAASGGHSLTARAVDRNGNAATATVSVRVDNEGPAVALTLPGSGAAVSGVVSLQADATDPAGVTRVDFFVDGMLLGTDTSEPYTVSWDSHGMADGAHSLLARAYDQAGNVRTSTAVVVTADNHLPEAALTAPTQGRFLRGTAVLEATASDANGVTKVEFYDGTTLLGTDSTSPHALSWNTVGVTNGAHTLTVRAYDLAGNVRTSAGVAVTVDNTTPTTAVSAPAQNASVRGTVPVSATASDTYGVERVEFYAGATLLGTATLAPYVVGWDTTTVANGTITLTTRAYDFAGNSTPSANLVITVDNAAPTVAITSPANGTSFSFLTFSTTVQASASDNVGVTQVVFYDGASVIGTDTTAPYSVSWSLGGVPKGTHTLTAKAHDAAGNVTTSSPISVKVN